MCESRVIQLGSPRAVESIKCVKSSSTSTSIPSLLVLPEGIIQECLLLFTFSLRCAFINPNVIFRWRTHPLISLKSVLQIISRDHQLPSNVVVSESSFESDICSSQYCLYRGSTAVVTAASSGLIPIHYQTSDFPDTDPLFHFPRTDLLYLMQFHSQMFYSGNVGTHKPFLFVKNSIPL